MRVLIRADASQRLGVGHIARCVTLADALRELGATVVFAMRALVGHQAARITGRGYHVIILIGDDEPAAVAEQAIDWQTDIAALTSQLAGQPTWDWLIVDHYGLDARWQGAARAFARRIAVIDDLANRAHDADLLVDHNLNADAVAYAALLPAQATRLLGPRYALISPRFAAEPVAIRPRASRVLVSLGGADADGYLFTVLDALESFTDIEADIVAGSANPAWDRLCERVSGRASWHLHRHVDDMAALMRCADLCIGAGGGSSWERAALGLPTLCLALAENQLANAASLAEIGAQIFLGRAADVTVERLRSVLSHLIDDRYLRHALGRAAHALVDGRGVQRVAWALLGVELSIRPAGDADSQDLYEGRNAERVRRFSLNKAMIAWSDHENWLGQVLADPDRALLIGEWQGRAMGVLRYDRQGGERARVSIYLLEAGRGRGRALLAAGERYIAHCWPELRVIEAEVAPDNLPSLKLFACAGYDQLTCRFERLLPGAAP